jgi:hypothetical protein
LSGTYAETYCAFDLAMNETGCLSSSIEVALPELEGIRSKLQEILLTGGRVELYVWLWPTEGEIGRGFELEPEAIRRMAELGLKLSVEVPN